MQFKDYYQILGVAKTASQDEIKSTFRKLARTHHPDVVKPKERAAAAEKFKEINEAYEVLGDPEKRQQYDTLGADWQQRGAPPRQRTAGRRQPEDFEFNFGGTGFSDFFEAFFGSAGRPAAAAANRGVDVEADLSVPLEEALHGARRKISFQRQGHRVQTYDIRIPPGVSEGQRIRLGGQGESGGDLYLNVRLAPHPDFQVDGPDLRHELDLPPWDLALGCETTVPTMEGAAKKLKVPAGSQPGQRFRLKGHGMPKPGGGRGDLYVVLGTEIPRALTPRQKELWQELQKTAT